MRTLKWVVLAVMVLGLPMAVSAHVKWFSNASFADAPRELGQVFTPLFIGLVALSAVTLGGLIFVESLIKHQAWYQRAINWFAQRRSYSTLIMRIGMGVTLLLSWQADTLLVPDLNVQDASWIGWLQFVIALLLLFPRTTPVAGAGVLALYGIGVSQFGAFYMLDYFAFVGIGVFLLLSNATAERIRALRIPALYFAVGFSLCWLALEKVVYPQWGVYILETTPQLALGLNPELFLLLTAFIEFALGYLLIIGLLERPMALAITLVFFTTTLFFGKVEVIGHTILHAALIVFLLEGPGTLYPRPVDIHKRLPLRVAFVAVNFVLVLIVMLLPYDALATSEYAAAQSELTSETTEMAETTEMIAQP